MIKDEAWSPPYVSTTSATAASNAEAIAETDITKFLTPATLAAYRAAVPGPIKLNFAGAPGTASGVDTGGFKSANFGLSTVSGGPSYFGGGIYAAASTRGTTFGDVSDSRFLDFTAVAAIRVNGAHLLWASDNTYDIGASGATRPRNIYAGGTLAIGNTATFGGLVFPQQATTAGAPAYVKGAIYFDTTLNKLRVGGATAWETITSV